VQLLNIRITELNCFIRKKKKPLFPPKAGKIEAMIKKLGDFTPQVKLHEVPS